MPVVVLYILATIVLEVSNRIFTLVEVNYRPLLRSHITKICFNYIINHSYKYFQNQFAGGLSAKISDICSGVIDLLFIIINKFFSQTVALIIAIIAVNQISYKFAILIISWVILVSLTSYKFLKKYIEYADEASEKKSEFTGRGLDILSNIINVKLFANKRHEMSLLEQYSQMWNQAVRKREIAFVSYETIHSLGFIIVQTICLVWLVKGLTAQQITPGDFALVISINLALFQAIWNLNTDMRNFSEALGSLRQGLRTIMVPYDLVDSEKAQELKIKTAKVTFKAVAYGYYKDKNLFKNLSLEILPKQKVGLVGHSGSGKTTFVNLLLRLYNIDSGAIEIDDQNINFIKQDSLRKAIAMISQDPILFHRSLIENIRYGDVNASDQNVFDAAKQAQAHEFIMSLPDDYNTIVGERGIKLSGGQRQRIAIARAG